MKFDRNKLLEQEYSTMKKINKEFLQESIITAFKQYILIEEIDLAIYDRQSGIINVLPESNINTPILVKLIEKEVVFNDIIWGEDIPLFENALNNLQERVLSKVDIRINIGSETIKDIRPFEATLINLTEIPEKILIILKNISKEVKQKKDLLKSKEKIEESDKLKSIILSNISHYIRTPLNSVTGFSELLASSSSESKRKEYIEIIKRQSKRILGLIDDLSEIAKLESGNIIITKTPCNLNLILRELLLGINHQRTKAQQELVEIKLDLPEEKGLELSTDSGRLLQTLNNLINYSLRYTQKGYVQIGYRLDFAIQKVIFFVKDTSAGLTKEEQKIIFNKFTVLDNMESSKFEDPGLGLTIARNIIKTLGGKIWIESEENNGNSFFFTIPYEPVLFEDNSEPETELHSENLFQWPNKVILVVDDEEINAMFIDAVLQGTNVQVLFARNGQEAVDLCKSINKIDLILMDLKMPVMNGIKATSEIRKFNNKIPIIAQTALASEEDKNSSLDAGCNNIITKPIEVKELLFKVNKYLAD